MSLNVKFDSILIISIQGVSFDETSTLLKPGRIQIRPLRIGSVLLVVELFLCAT